MICTTVEKPPSFQGGIRTDDVPGVNAVLIFPKSAEVKFPTMAVAAINGQKRGAPIWHRKSSMRGCTGHRSRATGEGLAAKCAIDVYVKGA